MLESFTDWLCKDANPGIALIGILPALTFWSLDAYYLQSEKLFRMLYAAATGPIPTFPSEYVKEIGIRPPDSSSSLSSETRRGHTLPDHPGPAAGREAEGHLKSHRRRHDRLSLPGITGSARRARPGRRRSERWCLLPPWLLGPRRETGSGPDPGPARRGCPVRG